MTRVLIIEDNPGDADLVRLALEGGAAPDAFEVEHVTSVAEGVARVVGSSPPDVVLLDLSLPDALGLDGLRRLKDAGRDVPVVVHTGSANREVASAAIQAGAQDYLVKGADAELVPRSLKYAIERHQHAARAKLLAGEQAARLQAEAARERMAVLAAASMAVCHSLDARHALRSMVSALVPRFADWCAVRARGTDEDSPEWIVAHADAGAAPGVAAQLDAAGSTGARGGPGAVGASAQAELHDCSGDGAPPTQWRTALRELGARSAMVVPVRLADEILGVLVVAACGASGRVFERDDLAVAEEIGRRAGVAVANCRLYLQARLAVTARDEFVSVAAHELRTPIAVLQLKLQQVAAKQQVSACATCEDAVPADYAGAARQIARLGRLIEELLDVSRIVDRRPRLEPEEIDLATVAQDAIERLGDLARQYRSRILLRCPAPVRGSWDRFAMDRIFANLLSNALKFGAEKPIDLRIRSAEGEAVIEVEDRGIGIAPEDVGRIFEQFERAVSTRHFGGLGLGLYITRRLVEEHGGIITVASRAGSGSLFTVRLPRAAPPSHAAEGL